MKTVILAGGFGTRLSRLTEDKPKPMVEIGGHPLLWHVMKHYAAWRHREFVLALGYRGSVIKHYFLNYRTMNSDVTVALATGDTTCHGGARDDWTVHLIDTGLNTNTGGRLKRLRSIVANDTFFMTYGDGLANVDLDALLAFHRSHRGLATVTCVRPPARFGHIELEGDRVVAFSEKPQTSEGWINGGFFVLEPEVLDYIDGDATSWEYDPMERLAREGLLYVHRHEGFWQCVDTPRDVHLLERLWASPDVPWKSWDRSAADRAAREGVSCVCS